MTVVVVVAVVIALLLGAAAGAALAWRSARAAVPDPRDGQRIVDLAADAARAGSPEGAHQPLASLVVEALDHGVIVVDRDELAVLVNPAARGMGILDADSLAFPDLTRVARAAIETGDHVVRTVDLPISRLGREPIALSVTAVPLRGASERIVAVCLLLADVSEQRRLEAVRRDFVANVSHELKTPVGALTLLAEAIQDAADEPEAVHRFAGRIQHEGSRLAKLVDELMELSRVQGADPMPGASEIELVDVIEEVIARTKLAAEQAAITVSASCPDSLTVRGNGAQLATAVANLVDNAIHYSPNGTRVAVTVRNSTDVDARPTIDISVTDQGMGIEESERERIFERFYRVDPARSRATGGTGLGLAIVKNIVTNHLGTVTVWSSVGAGSTFTVRLPRVHSDAPSSATRHAADTEERPDAHAARDDHRHRVERDERQPIR